MTASTRPRKAPRGAVYIGAKPVDVVTVDTLDQAIVLVRWLGSSAATSEPGRLRKARAEAVADWLADYAQRIERVEYGCQRLLLQAAEMVGDADCSRVRKPAA